MVGAQNEAQRSNEERAAARADGRFLDLTSDSRMEEDPDQRVSAPMDKRIVRAPALHTATNEVEVVGAQNEAKRSNEERATAGADGRFHDLTLDSRMEEDPAQPTAADLNRAGISHGCTRCGDFTHALAGPGLASALAEAEELKEAEAQHMITRVREDDKECRRIEIANRCIVDLTA